MQKSNKNTDLNPLKCCYCWTFLLKTWQLFSYVSLSLSSSFTAPAIRVVDEMGHDVNDRYYKLGSLIDISCQVAVSYLATLPPVPSENAKGQNGKNGAFGNLIDGDSKKTDGDGKVMKDRGPHYMNHKIEWKKDGDSLPGDVKISLR